MPVLNWTGIVYIKMIFFCVIHRKKQILLTILEKLSIIYIKLPQSKNIRGENKWEEYRNITIE